MRESECSPTSSSTFAGKYWKEVGTWSSTAGQGGLHSVVWKHTDSVPLSLLVRKHRITLPPYTMTKKVTRGKYSFCSKGESATRNLLIAQVWGLPGKTSSVWHSVTGKRRCEFLSTCCRSKPPGVASGQGEGRKSGPLHA